MINIDGRLDNADWPKRTDDFFFSKKKRLLLSSETRLHVIADKHVAQFSLAVRYAFAVARKAVKAKLISKHSKFDVATPIRLALNTVLPGMLVKIATDGGQMALDALPLRAAEGFRAAGPLKMKFDGKNLSVIEWAKKHAGELIVAIIETTLDQIQKASAEFQDEGDWDLYYGRILDAVGDEDRADLIARHETMLAAGEGQRLGWEQAKKAGFLDDSVKRVWITTPDERTCPICKGLEDKTAPLGGEYPGGYAGPPAHVQCRCTEGIQ